MRSRRAFTLLEVLLALALITLLMLGMISFLWSVSDARERIMSEARRSQALGGMMERLEADLLTCVAGDRTLGAGIKGEATSLSVLSRGVWLAGPEAVRRATPEQVDAGAATQQPSDLVGSSYALVRGADGSGRGLRIARWAAGPGLEASSAATAPSAISEDVEDVRFRYFDGSAWRERFDSLEEDGLPAAIEVSVWFRRGRGQAGTDAGVAPVEAGEREVAPGRQPDRVRVMAIPDGGVAGGGRG